MGNDNKNKKEYELLGFQRIRERLCLCANTMQAKKQAEELEPYLSELELRRQMRETTQARQLLEEQGTPPVPLMEHVEEYLERAVKGELLLPDYLEQIGNFLTAVRRLKSYLEKGKENQVGIAFYADNLVCLPELAESLERSVRSGRVDDYASAALRTIRKEVVRLEEKIQEKAESALRANRSYLADSFVVRRSGRICLPIKREYKSKIAGTVVDKSSTGATLFLEPASVAALREEYELCRIEEDAEERRILYQLTAEVAEREAELTEDIRSVIRLDFIFAKGKLSAAMKAVEPEINTEGRYFLEGARHPDLEETDETDRGTVWEEKKKPACIPLDFKLGGAMRGMVITGPNTGGKTVAIKTVGLLALMACSGLHVPCKSARISMSSQVLCDIGDGQNISDNLSTFSAHIGNVIEILQRVDPDSLVILDELGSGTDPAEGMGIAVAILEQLRQSGCCFLATTHYPEVKDYAEQCTEIQNARMAFDRESLRPLYRLEMGKAGESCALYIAKRLGLPNEMLRTAARQAYGTESAALVRELGLDGPDAGLKRRRMPGIRRKEEKVRKEAVHGSGFSRGDSVTVLPDHAIGIVVKPADSHGDVLVQIKKEKLLINHKRLKLMVAAQELYPEDYDFSILFDSVENRKARRRMEKGHQDGLVVSLEE